MTTDAQALFSIGDIVDHRLFQYQGVIFDVDPNFQQSDTWYDQVAKTRPPRDQPWYHVLPNGATHTTYVAERNLRLAATPDAVEHPLVSELFATFDGMRYRLREAIH